LDNNGNPTTILFPNVEFHTYPYVEQFGEMYIVPSTGRLTVSGTFVYDFPLADNAFFAIKSKFNKDSLLVFEDIFIPGLSNIPFIYELDVVEGDTLFADLNFIELNSFFGVDFIDDLLFNINGDQQSIKGGVYSKPSGTSSTGNNYRGWGQFAYNANNGRGASRLDFSKIDVDTTGLANDTLLIGEETDPNEVENGSSISSDELFIVMRSDPQTMAWQGSDPLTYLDMTCMSSSRNGNQDVDLSSVNSTGAGNIGAIDLITKYEADAGAAGVGANASPIGVGGGLTSANSWSISDITDMNGDRYPDYLSENTIQYIRLRGSVSSIKLTHNFGTHESGSFALGGGVGGSFVASSSKNSGDSRGKGSNKRASRSRSKNRSKMRSARSAFKSSKGSIGFNGSFTADRDSTSHTFLDINGDGLEDKIWKDGKVALNKGYSFEDSKDWNFKKIRKGSASDIGAGAGYDYANGSITAGLSVSRTESTSDFGFTDLNDDALIDLIVSKDPFVVRMNTGTGFGDEITILDENEFDQGVSIGESLNVAGTICINFFIIRVCFNASTSVGQGTSSVGSSFVDIDGDGYVDFLQAKGDDSDLKVRSSKVGRTNMLKTVYGPTGSEITLDYKGVGNTYGMPFSKWVMSDLRVYDGVDSDSVSTYTTKFDYQDPLYDRHERQLYGFAIVKEMQLDENLSEIRSITTEYNVENFYTKGLKKKQTIADATGIEFQNTKYEYSLLDVKSGSSLPPSFVDTDDGSAFPALTKKTVTISEGLSDINLKRTFLFEYDSLGNNTIEIDIDDAGSDIRIEKEYQYNLNSYLVDKVKIERIFGDNQLYRLTEFLHDEFGNVIQMKEKIEGDNYAISNMTYDLYGNLLTSENPENYNGERLLNTYAYDSLLHQNLVYELDGYGYESFFEYENLHNQITKSIDINGNTTLYNVDTKGRTESIIFPYEFEKGLPYSIRYEYFPMSDVAYSVAHHFDPSHQGDLNVYVFEDGLQRQIQTKIKADLFDGTKTEPGYIVSGTDFFDALGRKVTAFLPIQEFGNTPFVYNEINDVVRPTRTEYDILDRPTRVVDTYGGETIFEYSISNTNNNEKALSTFKRNPLGNTSHEFYNTRGNILAERFDGPREDIWRNYKYDGFSQVKEIIDAKQNTTVYEYDLLGRRISVKVPDAGTTVLNYDNANNLIERITATIRDVVSSDGAIRYSYDKERLIQIDYPKYFQNKVQIHYGAPQDSFNRAGRIWLQEDASGGREYFFDANGNPTKIIRTVMINRANIFTYVSEYTYDTWGRVKSMKYPDGEEVIYKYNKGGQLESLLANKNNRESIYLEKMGYDKFGDRIYLKYGNGVVDNYTYDEKGRLSNRQTQYNSRIYSKENYKYDLVDNLTNKINSGLADDILGGQHTENFSYDVLQRLSTAEGTWQGDQDSESYKLFLDYDALNNVTMKSQNHEANDSMQIYTSRTWDYQYESEQQPTRPSEIGGKEISYDKNGNMLLSTSNAIFDFDQNIYDEENRLIGTSSNGVITRYTYDAFGKRVLKSNGSSQGVFINGSPAGFLEHKLNFKADVSPYFTVFKNEYRKHYFVDGKRILSKIGTGLFETTLGTGPEITAGSIDYKSRIQQYEYSILQYYSELGVAPGAPTLLAYNGQPEINTSTLPDATAGAGYNLPPSNWPNLPPPDTLGPPGIPVFYDITNFSNATVEAGYNFSAGNITQELEQFYYHYDNTGSTHFISDYNGEPRQYVLYFPTGESWISKSIGIDSTPYMFKGLELDYGSGLYNMGNIYYNPVTNVELSIEPILQNFGHKTFLERPEGSLFYDYAEISQEGNNTDFDNEILNSERPDPFLLETVNVDIDEADDSDVLDYKRLIKDLGGKEPGWDVSIDDINPDSEFFVEISELVPHLNTRNLKNKKEFNALVKEVLVDPKREKAKQAIKKFFSLKDKKGKPERKKTKRKVRFK
jgi:YD repeat-containing protein